MGTMVLHRFSYITISFDERFAVREKANTAATYYSADNHCPKADGEGLNGSSNSEDNCTYKESALASNHVSHSSCRYRGKECANFEYRDHHSNFACSRLIEVLLEVGAGDDTAHYTGMELKIRTLLQAGKFTLGHNQTCEHD